MIPARPLSCRCVSPGALAYNLVFLIQHCGDTDGLVGRYFSKMQFWTAKCLSFRCGLLLVASDWYVLLVAVWESGLILLHHGLQPIRNQCHSSLCYQSQHLRHQAAFVMTYSAVVSWTPNLT